MVPITSVTTKPELPTHVNLKESCLEKEAVVELEQIRVVDRLRFKEFVGYLGDDIMKQIDRVLQVSVGLS